MILFLIKFISNTCVFIAKINGKHILINEESNQKILRFFKIFGDSSRANIEPESQDPGN